MSEDTDLKQTSIKLRPKHFEIVEENGLNLSKWVRKKLERDFGDQK
jgi:hypothetical protein